MFCSVLEASPWLLHRFMLLVYRDLDFVSADVVGIDQCKTEAGEVGGLGDAVCGDDEGVDTVHLPPVVSTMA
jgi:hypothetical protein